MEHQNPAIRISGLHKSYQQLHVVEYVERQPSLEEIFLATVGKDQR